MHFDSLSLLKVESTVCFQRKRSTLTSCALNPTPSTCFLKQQNHAQKPREVSLKPLRIKSFNDNLHYLRKTANHPGQSLADLYDPMCMPTDLRKAHDELDKIVDVAFDATKPCTNNDERLEILFKSYIHMTKE